MRNDLGLRLVPFLLLAPLVAACGRGGAALPDTLRVMTRNVYYGADLGPAIVAVESGDPAAIVGAVTQVWADVQATNFALRAQALAAEIEAHAPDLVGLQEAALWRVQSPSDTFTADPTSATQVAADFVQLLLDALAARGLAYEAVVISEGFDVELPALDGSFELFDVRLTDREALLARSDLAARGIRLENPVAGHFATNLVLDSGFEARCGWASVDVRGRLGSLRFVTTHLEADVPEIRQAQALELLASPLAAPGDVVLVGDINDDALAPDPGGAYEMLLAAGLLDAWSAAVGALPGQTCCFDALLADPGAPLTQRVDQVLVRGSFEVRSATVVGAAAADRVGGLWPSDHAGLVATLAR